MVNPDQLKFILIVICKSAMTKKILNMATSLSRIDFNLFRLSFLIQGKFTLNDDSQDDTKFGSSGDDLQAFIDEFDLMISNQDGRYTILTHTHIYMCVCDVVVV